MDEPYLPLSQDRQSLLDVLPNFGLYLPAEQLVHA